MAHNRGVNVVGEALAVEFLDPLAEDEPRPMEVSALVPLCTTAFVPEGLALARVSVSLDDLDDPVRRAMEAVESADVTYRAPSPDPRKSRGSGKPGHPETHA